MAHFRTALAHRIEYLKGRYQFFRAIDLDLDPSGGHFFHPLGKAVRPCAQARIVLGPGSDHFPFVGLLAWRFLLGLRRCRHRLVCRRAIFLFTAGQCQATQP